MNHSKLLERTKSFVKKNKESSLCDSDTKFNPDICVKNSTFWNDEDVFDEVWIEVEISSIRTPAKIIRKMIGAFESNAKLIFSVPAKNDKRRDYYANRIDKIIGPPELASKRVGRDKYQLYNSKTPIKTEDGEKVMIQKDVQTNWIFTEKSRSIRLSGYDEDQIRITDPSKSLTISKDQIDDFETEEDRIMVGCGDNGSEYKRLNKPAYPFGYPRVRISTILDSVEYLVFSDNIVYTRKHPKIETYLQSMHH